MKNNLHARHGLMAGSFLALLLLAYCTGNPSDLKKPNAYAPELKQNASLCEPSWFPHSQTPAPAEGDGSPFDTSSTTNSIFHQWSWQKFLWLTKPLPTGHTLFEDSMTVVNSALMPVAPVMGMELVLSDSMQAGGNPHGVLMSNKTYGSGTHTVYYAIFANNTLLDFSKLMKDSILANPKMVNNTASFPVGSLELKTSWIQASAIPAADLKSYYTTKAYVSALKDTATVALLGMHVVGVVKNHPEFIWATFEHYDMAPRYDWAATTNQDVPVTSSTNRLLFTQGYQAGLKDITYGGKPVPQNVFGIFHYGVPRTAKNAFMPNLSQDSSSNKSNFDNIDNLNQCVKESLTDVWKNYFYNGSIWLNTDGLTPAQQVSQILKATYNLGNVQTGSPTRGSLAAYNVTMETYMQNFGSQTISGMSPTTLANCMDCHSGYATVKINGTSYSGSQSTLYLSHIFTSYLSVSGGTTMKDIDANKIKDFMLLKKMKMMK